MSGEFDRVLMHHMLDHSRKAVELLTLREQSDGPDDQIAELALSKLLTMIGSAAERVSETTKDQYPDIPWKSAVEIKYFLIERFDEVDLELVMDLASKQAPTLINHLERELEEGDGE